MDDIDSQNIVDVEPQTLELAEEPQVELDLSGQEQVTLETRPEEAEKEEVPKKRKFHIDAKGRISQLTREKYEAQHATKVKEEEVEKLRSEVERLSKLTEQSSQAAMAHYDDSVKLRMDQAELKLSKAIQEGDVSEQIKATSEIAKAQAQQENINSWKANQQYIKNQVPEPAFKPERVVPGRPYQATTQEVEQPELTPEAHEWLNRNTWFHPQSEDFDNDLAREVQSYEALLYNKMLRAGQEDKILGKEYFDEIDRYIKHEIYGEPEVQPGRVLNMRQTRSPVAPVSHGGVQNRNAAPKFKLPHGMSEQEFKSFISNLKVDPKEYMETLRQQLVDRNAKIQDAIVQGRY